MIWLTHQQTPWASYSDHSVWRLPPTVQLWGDLRDTKIWSRLVSRPAHWPSRKLRFQFPVRESLESCSSGELQGVCGLRGDPATTLKQSRSVEVQQMETDRGEEWESWTRHASLARSQRWGKGARRASHWPLSDWWCHQTVAICDGDCTGIEGEQLERGLSRWPSNHEAAGLPPKGHNGLLHRTQTGRTQIAC